MSVRRAPPEAGSRASIPAVLVVAGGVPLTFGFATFLLSRPYGDSWP